MSTALFVAVSPGEIWAALEEAGELAALRLIRTGAPSRVGEVFLGRVVALRPELPAALVDIGLDRPGFLDARDIDRKRGLAGLTEGQALIVEVTRDARADKAAGLRLCRIAGERRARIDDAARAAKPPVRLEPAAPAIVALLNEFLKSPPERIVIDDRASFAEARLFLRRERPDLVARLQFYDEATPLMEHAGLAAAIAAAMGARVALPCGGAIIVETTHVATTIDVDGGKASALAANLEAARAAARQIGLRNLAGPIVIDFIGMKKRADRDKVLAGLKAALAADGEKPDLLGWTRLGHVELVRRRRHAPLAELLFERAPDGSQRKTALSLALDALRAVEREARAQPGRRLAVAVHPEVAAALGEGEGLTARRVVERRLGHALAVEAQPQRARETSEIRGEER